MNDGKRHGVVDVVSHVGVVDQPHRFYSPLRHGYTRDSPLKADHNKKNNLHATTPAISRYYTGRRNV